MLSTVEYMIPHRRELIILFTPQMLLRISSWSSRFATWSAVVHTQTVFYPRNCPPYLSGLRRIGLAASDMFSVCEKQSKACGGFNATHPSSKEPNSGYPRADGNPFDDHHQVRSRGATHREGCAKRLCWWTERDRFFLSATPSGCFGSDVR